jgi:hypothetical protein
MVRTAKKMPTETLKQRVWETADALPGSEEASEQKKVELRLMFLKYISNCFVESGSDIGKWLEADGTPQGRCLPAPRRHLSNVGMIKLGHEELGLCVGTDTW